MTTLLCMLLVSWCWLALVWLSGWAVIGALRRIFRDKRPPDDLGLTEAGEAFLLGVLLCVVPLYVLLAVAGTISTTAYVLVLLGQVGLALPGALAARRWFAENPVARRIVVGLFPWMLLMAVAASAVDIWGYDARAIYGLKAKLLADQMSVFGPDFCDPYRAHFWNNYPLLVPLLEAQVFFWRNGVAGMLSVPLWYDVGLPIIFWGFVTALVLLAALEVERRSPGWGLWVGYLLALVPMVWHWTEGSGLSGSADLVLATLILAAVLSLARGFFDQHARNRRELLLAGLFLAGTMLTKQEGKLATGLIILALIVTWFWSRRLRGVGVRMRTGLGRRLTGLGMVLVIVLATGGLLWWIHGAMPLPPYARPYTAALRWDWLSHLGERPLVLATFAADNLVKNHWGMLWVVLGLSLCLRRGEPLSPEFFLVRLTALFLIFAYFAIFLVTPYPLLYQLHSAFARLMLHALPLALLVACEQLQAAGWPGGSQRPLASSGLGMAGRKN